MKLIIKLIGKKDDIEQAVGELRSNILYDNLKVEVVEVEERKN